jgi:hypothetical protein
MKRYLCLLALVCLGCLGAPAHADGNHVDENRVGEDHAALVKTVTGVVNVTRQHDTFAATGGTTLRVSDRVVTAPGASAAIVFRDGTLLTLGSGADIVVRDYVFAPKDDKFAFSLYLAKGSAIYESGKIGKLSPQSVKIETPKATVAVRGTRFLIEAN